MNSKYIVYNTNGLCRNLVTWRIFCPRVRAMCSRVCFPMARPRYPHPHLHCPRAGQRHTLRTGRHNSANTCPVARWRGWHSARRKSKTRWDRACRQWLMLTAQLSSVCRSQMRARRIPSLTANWPRLDCERPLARAPSPPRESLDHCGRRARAVAADCTQRRSFCSRQSSRRLRMHIAEERRG